MKCPWEPEGAPSKTRASSLEESVSGHQVKGRCVGVRGVGGEEEEGQVEC